MKVAIHQPNFMPWIGFFEKINSVDKFVVLDHVQASRGKSWINRNKIEFNQEVRWLTLPIRKINFQSIREVNINYDSDFIKSHLGMMKQEYAKYENFEFFFDFFQNLYHQKELSLVDFNLQIIRFFCQQLAIQTEFISSTEIVQSNPYIADLRGNDLVLELCKVLGVETYISGTGCTDFIQPKSFEANQIKFLFQKFNSEKFTSSQGDNLSIVDFAFRKGVGLIKAEFKQPNEEY